MTQPGSLQLSFQSLMLLLLVLWKSGKTASGVHSQAGIVVHNLGLTPAQVCVQAADRVLP